MLEVVVLVDVAVQVMTAKRVVFGLDLLFYLVDHLQVPVLVDHHLVVMAVTHPLTLVQVVVVPEPILPAAPLEVVVMVDLVLLLFVISLDIDTLQNLIYTRPEYIIGIWHFNQFGIIPTCPKIL